jgi:hypothetical protein
MNTSPLSSQEIRAAAEAHRELGPDYHDAVVESFLSKVEKEIEARVEARLAESPPRSRKRELDPATLAKRRLVLQSATLGSVGAAIPLSFLILGLNPYNQNGVRAALIVVWILIAAVYTVVSAFLRPSRRDRELERLSVWRCLPRSPSPVQPACPSYLGSIGAGVLASAPEATSRAPMVEPASARSRTPASTAATSHPRCSASSTIRRASCSGATIASERPARRRRKTSQAAVAPSASRAKAA